MHTYDFSELSDIQLLLSAIKKNCDGSIYIYILNQVWMVEVKELKKKKKK